MGEWRWQAETPWSHPSRFLTRPCLWGFRPRLRLRSPARLRLPPLAGPHLHPAGFEARLAAIRTPPYHAVDVSLVLPIPPALRILPIRPIRPLSSPRIPSLSAIAVAVLRPAPSLPFLRPRILVPFRPRRRGRCQCHRRFHAVDVPEPALRVDAVPHAPFEHFRLCGAGAG